MPKLRVTASRQSRGFLILCIFIIRLKIQQKVTKTLHRYRNSWLSSFHKVWELTTSDASFSMTSSPTKHPHLPNIPSSSPLPRATLMMSYDTITVHKNRYGADVCTKTWSWLLLTGPRGLSDWAVAISIHLKQYQTRLLGCARGLPAGTSWLSSVRTEHLHYLSIHQSFSKAQRVITTSGGVKAVTQIKARTLSDALYLQPPPAPHRMHW